MTDALGFNLALALTYYNDQDMRCSLMTHPLEL